MAKLPYRTHYDRPADCGKECKGESMTQPGQALTIQQVLQKHKAGMPMPDKGDAIYFDEKDLEKINKFHAPHKLDLTDIDELYRNFEEQKEAMENILERKKQAEKEAEKERELQERLKAEKEKEKESESESKDED